MYTRFKLQIIAKRMYNWYIPINSDIRKSYYLLIITMLVPTVKLPTIAVIGIQIFGTRLK